MSELVIRQPSKRHLAITASTEADHARFMSLVSTAPHPKGCHEWTGKISEKGYGKFCIRTENLLAHRLSYFIHNKRLSHDLIVCHSCDNTRCVNPEHLFEGTNKDNAEDKMRKGRHPSTWRTHCPVGHEYTPENTRWHGKDKTKRQCIICQRQSATNSRRKKQFMEDELKAKLAEAEKTIAELLARPTAAREDTDAANALERLHRIIDSAGVDKLMRGVELGQISWYHKANDAMKHAEAVLAARCANKGKEEKP